MGLYASPRDPSWNELMEVFDNLREWLFHSLKLPLALQEHQRGRYATFGVGYGFGGGRIRPGNYVSSTNNAKLLQQALDTPVIRRIARYVDRKLNSLPQLSVLTSPSEGLLALFPMLHLLYTNLTKNIVDIDNPKIQ